MDEKYKLHLLKGKVRGLKGRLEFLMDLWNIQFASYV